MTIAASFFRSNQLTILFREGFSKLYAGIGPALILTINPGLEFTIMESLKDFYTDKTGKTKLSSSVNFVIAAMGKIGATLSTYPYILAKVRMQNSGETSMLTLVSKMFAETGVLGFYSGMQIQLIKSITFATTRNVMKELLLGWSK